MLECGLSRRCEISAVHVPEGFYSLLDTEVIPVIACVVLVMLDLA